jgi:hypothetical protein
MPQQPTVAVPRLRGYSIALVELTSQFAMVVGASLGVVAPNTAGAGAQAWRGGLPGVPASPEA